MAWCQENDESQERGDNRPSPRMLLAGSVGPLPMIDSSPLVPFLCPHITPLPIQMVCRRRNYLICTCPAVHCVYVPCEGLQLGTSGINSLLLPVDGAERSGSSSGAQKVRECFMRHGDVIYWSYVMVCERRIRIRRVLVGHVMGSGAPWRSLMHPWSIPHRSFQV